MSGLTRARSLGWKAMLGIILVPLTIAGLFIWGLWNPTDRLRTVEAAVVNLDQPVTIDGQYTPLGRVFAGALIGDSSTPDDETNFSWYLTNADDAAEGLNEGRYSTVVTIPKNFSAAATSAADPATAEQATIDIATSDRGRLIDSALSNVVTSTATRVLNEQLGTAFVDQIFVGMGTLQVSLGEAATGADQLADGSQQLAGGANGLADGTKQLSDGAGALAGGVSGIASGLGEYADGTSALASGARQAADGTDAYVAGVGQLVDGLRAAIGPITGAIGAASQAIDALEIDPATGMPVGMADPTVGTTTLGTQLDGLDASLAQAGDVSTLAADCATSGADTAFCARVAASADAVTAARGDAAAVRATQQQLAAEALATKTTLTSVFAQISAAKPYLDGLSAQLGGLDAQLGQLAAAGPQVAAGNRAIANGIGTLAASGAEIANGAGALATGAQELAAGTPALADGAAQLADGADKAATGTVELADGLNLAAGGVPNYTESERETLARSALTPVVATGSGDELFNAAGVPLFTGIALWAGGLAAFLVLTPLWRRTRTAARGLGAITMRSALPGLIAGALQGLLVGIAMPIALGLDAGATASFISLSVLAGVSFALLNQGLAALFGSAGRFVSLLILVIAFAGGIVSTAPEALRAIGDATPIGAAFSGFQSIASGASGAGGSATLLVLWGLIGLAFTAFAAARVRKADRVPGGKVAAVPPQGVRELQPA